MDQASKLFVQRTSRIAPRRNDNALEDWDLFVLRHRNYPNICTHILSFALFWFTPVLAITVSPWWWVGFFSSGFVGTAGHYIFRDGVVDFREATSRWQVVYYSSCMILLFLSGTYASEIKTAEHKYELYLKNEMESVASPDLFTKIK
jgi:hypothetical protein